MTKHAASAVKKADMLAVALRLAAKHGYMQVTREMIAAECGVHASNVSYHMGTMAELRRDIVRHAVLSGHLSVVAQALAMRDKHALKAPEDLKARARAAV